jgi:hypothetical protein
MPNDTARACLVATRYVSSDRPRLHVRVAPINHPQETDVSLYLPGAKIVPGRDGGTMLGGPNKVVWHTTENDPTKTTALAIANYLLSSGNTVHLVWNPVSGEKVAMLPTDLAGRGLENRAGGVETNRAGRVVIQIEVVGWASQPFTDGPCNGLPEIQVWLRTLSVPAVWSGTLDRSIANWAKSGHFGHMDVPENSHTDPGLIDKAKLTTPTPEVDMPLTPQEITAITVGAAEQVWHRFTVNGLTLQAALGRLVAASDPTAFAAAVAKALPTESTATVTQAQLEAALRTVLGSVDGKV